MKTDTAETETGTGSGDPSTDAIFELLADARRRYLLHYLSQRVGAVDVSDVAEQIALWEGDASRGRYERVLTGLVHVHLPKLEDAGVVSYDRVLETITRREPAERITPYLELAASDDFR